MATSAALPFKTNDAYGLRSQGQHRTGQYHVLGCFEGSQDIVCRGCQGQAFFLECLWATRKKYGRSLAEGWRCWSVHQLQCSVKEYFTRFEFFFLRLGLKISHLCWRFTLYERKHHCRNCGQVFCNKCSRFESEISRLRILKPVRVCQKCYQSLKQSNETS